MENSSLLASEAVEKKGIIAVVLAAGQGKRMCSETPKVAHLILGKPLIYWPLEALAKVGIEKIVVVLSPTQKAVAKLIENFRHANTRVEVAFQNEPLGTAHALSSAMPTVKKMLESAGQDLNNAHVMVCMGDMPAIASSTYDEYASTHLRNQNAVTVMAFSADNPTGYGRVLTKTGGEFIAIREHKDCSEAEREVKLCNSGFLFVRYTVAATLLPQIKNENAAKEYYLTDLPSLAKANAKIGVFSVKDPLELEGINSQAQLAGVAKYMQNRIVQKWMTLGVQFFNPEQVYLEDSVELESGVVVEPFVYVAGNSRFKKGDRIQSGSRWVNGTNTNES